MTFIELILRAIEEAEAKIVAEMEREDDAWWGRVKAQIEGHEAPRV